MEVKKQSVSDTAQGEMKRKHKNKTGSVLLKLFPCFNVDILDHIFCRSTAYCHLNFLWKYLVKTKDCIQLCHCASARPCSDCAYAFSECKRCSPWPKSFLLLSCVFSHSMPEDRKHIVLFLLIGKSFAPGSSI